MPEQGKDTTKDKWFKKWTSRLLWLAGQFEFVREVLIFTFFAWSFGFWWWRGELTLLPYITAIIITHIVGLVVLGIVRMIVNPDVAASKSKSN